jgi:pSer/pThr/pTyr-binding forkhead associated (FHA) protein
MREGKLIFDGKEIALGKDIITFGRASDNTIAFPSDSNVSRYHAEIELRLGEHLLIDLGSSNGTTLNGQKVNGEVKLSSGGTILFGGSSEVKVIFDGEAEENREDSEADDEDEFSAGGGSGMSGFSGGGGGGGGSLLTGMGGGGSAAGGGTAGAAGGGSAAAASASAGSNQPSSLASSSAGWPCLCGCGVLI